MARPSAMLPGAALLATVLLTAGEAHAQSAAAAEELFRAGREAMKRGDHREACARFGESHRLDPAAGTLLNIGGCNEKLGRLASAWEAYADAAHRLNDERRAFALEKRDTLRAQVATVALRRDPAAGPGCVVHQDGLALGAAAEGLPLPIDAGEHTFELRCPGRAPAVVRASVADGAVSQLALTPGALLGPAPDPAARPGAPGATPAPAAGSTEDSAEDAAEDGPSAVLVAGLTATGIGVAGIGLGAVTGALTIGRKGVVDDACSTPSGGSTLQCSQEGLDAAAEGRTFATVSTVGFIVGGVALGLGATLLVVHASSSSAPAVEVAAWGLPGDGGIRVRTRF